MFPPVRYKNSEIKYLRMIYSKKYDVRTYLNLSKIKYDAFTVFNLETHDEKFIKTNVHTSVHK